MDPEPLTPSHLLYGRQTTALPFPLTDNDELTDPTFITRTVLLDKVRRQDQLLQHFQTCWKREYVTLLMETHIGGGTKQQTVKIGDVVLVHDDVPRTRWQLAVVEELITPHTDSGNVFDVQVLEEATPSCTRVTRSSAVKAHERIKNWTNTLSVAWRMSGIDRLYS